MECPRTQTSPSSRACRACSMSSTSVSIVMLDTSPTRSSGVVMRELRNTNRKCSLSCIERARDGVRASPTTMHVRPSVPSMKYSKSIPFAATSPRMGIPLRSDWRSGVAQPTRHMTRETPRIRLWQRFIVRLPFRRGSADKSIEWLRVTPRRPHNGLRFTCRQLSLCNKLSDPLGAPIRAIPFWGGR